MIYELPSLAYPYDALAPHIDARTMEIHHTKHHAGYIAKLNKALESCPEIRETPLEEILTDLKVVPEDLRQSVRNNGGGHLNHTLFWETMAPGCVCGPTGEFAEAISSTFGSFGNFREQFGGVALTRFGSGWAWLGLDKDRRLDVFSTANQDSPLMLGYRPLLGLDVWEHAYYLTYQNRRADYIAAWWNVVNWKAVAESYARLVALVGRAH